MLIPIYEDPGKKKILGYVDDEDIRRVLPRVELQLAGVGGEIGPYVVLEEFSPFGPGLSRARLPSGDLFYKKTASGWEIERRPSKGDHIAVETLDSHRLMLTAETPEVYFFQADYEFPFTGDVSITPIAGDGEPKALAQGNYLVFTVARYLRYGSLQVLSAPGITWWFSPTRLPSVSEGDRSSPLEGGADYPVESRYTFVMSVDADKTPGSVFTVSVERLQSLLMTFVRMPMAAS